jgi:guanosine-3',5'-bis(diphosphate) 3'-pyrophosphohydrolase
MTELETRARLFATAAHAAVGQLRKYTHEPYIVHPAEVAKIVRSVPHTEVMLAAAWLHDTVEDTGVSIELIRAEFGSEVSDLVGWLTDVSRPDHGNRAARKAVDRAHTAAAPAEAQTVKCADLCSNTRSIAAHDPKFAETYLVEKRQLLEVMTKAEPAALRLAQEALDSAERALQLSK